MNDKTSDKWDVIKWCGKIIKYVFDIVKWHFFATSAIDAHKAKESGKIVIEKTGFLLYGIYNLTVLPN